MTSGQRDRQRKNKARLVIKARKERRKALVESLLKS